MIDESASEDKPAQRKPNRHKIPELNEECKWDNLT